jgi:hypothetical protein
VAAACRISPVESGLPRGEKWATLASHVTPHTSDVSHHTSHVSHHTSHLTRHTSHVTPHTSLVTRHTSHVTRHTSHVTRHTSHVTRHTLHVTRHSSHSSQCVCHATSVASSKPHRFPRHIAWYAPTLLHRLIQPLFLTSTPFLFLSRMCAAALHLLPSHRAVSAHTNAMLALWAGTRIISRPGVAAHYILSQFPVFQNQLLAS